MPANYHQYFGVAAGIVSAVAFVPYIRAIWRRETIPNRVTWFIWTINGWLVLASYHEVGANATIWLAVSYAILPSVILALSVRLGEGGWSKFDITCLAIAVAGLSLWWFTQSALSGLVCFISADFAAALPTICKSWQRPHTEDRLAWTITAIGSIVSLASIDKPEFGVIVYPVYMATANGLIAFFIWRPVICKK